MGEKYDEYFRERESFRERNMDLLEKGVEFLDIDSVFIDEKAKVGKGTIIFPNVIITGDTQIGENCCIYGNSRIESSQIADEVHVDNSVILESTVGFGTKIGPFAYIRPNSKIGEKCKIGDFVEVKNSVISNGSKASHLTYIGDAQVGENVNLGCGVVFVNYNGKTKQKVIVKDNAFVGCNSNLVAPVEIGENSYIGAGSTVTEKVEENSLYIARAKGVTKRNWKLKK